MNAWFWQFLLNLIYNLCFSLYFFLSLIFYLNFCFCYFFAFFGIISFLARKNYITQDWKKSSFYVFVFVYYDCDINDLLEFWNDFKGVSIPSIGVALHRWSEITQSLKFNCFYKSHCKSCELLWVLYNMVTLKCPQQFVGFAVTLVKIFNFET